MAGYFIELASDRFPPIENRPGPDPSETSVVGTGRPAPSQFTGAGAAEIAYWHFTSVQSCITDNFETLLP